MPSASTLMRPSIQGYVFKRRDLTDSNQIPICHTMQKGSHISALDKGHPTKFARAGRRCRRAGEFNYTTDGKGRYGALTIGDAWSF